MNKQICVECNSIDLVQLEDYPHILECNNCGHPNDIDLDLEDDEDYLEFNEYED